MERVVLHVERVATEAATMGDEHTFIVGGVVNISNGE